jgi:hypothetical protein
MESPSKLAAVLAAALLAAAPLPLEAGESIGKITYLDGTLEIERDEEPLNPKLVKQGLALENFDLLVTGDDGEAELQISSPRSPPSTIRVAPGTRFSLEIGRAGGREQTSVGLMIGSVTLKCAKLSGSQSVKVQTDTALMGVRGTTFTVTSAASGDLLVDCDEGEVECTDAQGATQRANPGEAVEMLVAERFRRVPVPPAGLAEYRRNWQIERLAALRARAGTAIQELAVRYVPLLAQFNRDFASLETARTTIDRWRSEDRAGRIGALAETTAQLRALGPALKRLRGELVPLERIHARLAVLQKLHEQGIGRGIVRYGQTSETTARFFERFARDRRVVERRMATVRLVARLYARRNGDRIPGGSFGGQEEEGSFLE